MKIGYVCTNYNNSAVTARAIETLQANRGHETHAVVVDNASNAEEVEELRQLESDGVELICLSENIGYFSGLNVGIRHLRKTRPNVEWMVIGNNDLEFPQDFADKLERLALEFRPHPVISPDIVTGDGDHQNPHVISSISMLREIFYDLYYSNYYIGMFVQKAAMKFRGISDRSDESEWQTARPIYQGHGSVYLLGPRFFELFDELWAPTFMMSEEYFLSKQLSDVGERVFYDPRIMVRHLWHASVDQLPSRRRWEIARDAHRVYRKYVKEFG
jgi:GT2 family glycosyltransferase